MIRHMCFDTESDAYRGVEYGWGEEPDDIRWYFERRRRPVSFHCGIVYDASRHRYHDFGPNQASEMLNLLSQADELVSFNGKRWDFIILETQLGYDRVELSLAGIRHYDLWGHKGQWSLRGLGRSVLSKNEMKRLDDESHEARYVAAGFGDFLSSRLSKCARDVQLTYAVFRHLQDDDGTREPPDEPTVN
jgi:hypothetical protein